MNKKDFDFWIANNLNVLFVGEHGVGKTARVIESFEEHGLKWKYFSAATIDPWVDFIGIPKASADNKHLEFIRPREFENDEIEAIFFDEFNRAPKKVLNAVMELIQFKSINGKKFNNLRFIWAAINPTDDENTYSVNDVDPAQFDRFHVHVQVPYRVDRTYFTKKYGVEHTEAAIEWWEELPEKIQKEVSPRRLDYAMSIFNNGGDIAYALPQSSNFSKLLNNIASGTCKGRIEKLLRNKQDTVLWEKELQDPNLTNWIVENAHGVVDLNPTGEIFEFLPSEDTSRIVNKHYKSPIIYNMFKLNKNLQKLIIEITSSSPNTKRKLKNFIAPITKNNSSTKNKSSTQQISLSKNPDYKINQIFFTYDDINVSTTARRSQVWRNIWKFVDEHSISSVQEGNVLAHNLAIILHRSSYITIENWLFNDPPPTSTKTLASDILDKIFTNTSGISNNLYASVVDKLALAGYIKCHLILPL